MLSHWRQATVFNSQASFPIGSTIPASIWPAFFGLTRHHHPRMLLAHLVQRIRPQNAARLQASEFGRLAATQTESIRWEKTLRLANWPAQTDALKTENHKFSPN